MSEPQILRNCIWNMHRTLTIHQSFLYIVLNQGEKNSHWTFKCIFDSICYWADSQCKQWNIEREPFRRQSNDLYWINNAVWVSLDRFNTTTPMHSVRYTGCAMWSKNSNYLHWSLNILRAWQTNFQNDLFHNCRSFRYLLFSISNRAIGKCWNYEKERERDQFSKQQFFFACNLLFLFFFLSFSPIEMKNWKKIQIENNNWLLSRSRENWNNQFTSFFYLFQLCLYLL